jgi:hypothetical protein
MNISSINGVKRLMNGDIYTFLICYPGAGTKVALLLMSIWNDLSVAVYKEKNEVL